MLVSHLTAHDEEDSGINKQDPRYKALNDKLRIVKVSYPSPENSSQEAYEKTYGTDVPDDFLLDTYYMKLKKDETVEVLVTFAVTDSNGNTTEEELPVKVKYNNPPKLECDDEYYYFKEDVNRSMVTEELLLSYAEAEDIEDGVYQKGQAPKKSEYVCAPGEVKPVDYGNIKLVDFDPQELKMQTEYRAEYPIKYEVTDAYGKTTKHTLTDVVWDDVAYNAEQRIKYVRFISKKYLWTLEENSIWREPKYHDYLVRVLDNTTPMEVWEFTHEDVLAVQDWITEDGDGHWKIGQEANREFLRKFSYCRKERNENYPKLEE